jgi:bifunctional DNA-binding transcriptional regulator/antitoxin component of YhaV-PrlF toxin-antitoxin module
VGKFVFMKLAKLMTNGRVTLPAELRKKYKLTPGRRVRFETAEDGVRITPLAAPEEIRANIGFLGLKGKLLKSLLEEKKIEREL